MGRARRWLDRLGFVGLSSGVVLAGFVQGTSLLTFRLELAVFVLVVALLQAVVSSLVFTGFVSLSSLLFLSSIRGERASTCTSGPTVTAIVPVYQDASVLHRSVESLRGSDYADLEICIVPEADDHRSRRRANQLAAYPDVQVLTNTRYPGSKAGAINYAVEETESDHVAVFDADEQVDPSFVGQAVERLEDCDVVQGRTVPEPTGLIEELAYYESVLLSYVARRLLYRVTDFRMAASRAVVMRRSAFEQVGGYDETMLTEDFDFAYRCYRSRLEVEELLGAPSRIEAAHSLRDWWGQRKRWMTGYAQVLHRLLGEVRPLTDYRNVTSAVLCAGTIVGSLLMLSMLSKFLLLLAIGSQVLVLLPLLTVMAATASIRLYDSWTGAVDSVGVAWLVVPVVLPLYSLTAIKAVLEYLFSWDGGWYSVEKGV